MKNYLLLTISFLFFANIIFATGVKGRVYNETGEPLAYAAIYVKESGSGTTANSEGYYELRLAPGQYTLIFQFLGYQPQSQQVTITNNFLSLDIELKREALDLQAVDIVGSKEDPAYSVMRKAIAKASYHRQQLDTYTAEVYIKGTGRLKDSPKLFEGLIEQEGIDSTIAFTSESVSEITFTRPDSYEEKVISIYVQGEDNNTSPNSFIQGSFYDPIIAESVSPLSPRAFAYYRFKYEGYFEDRGYGVNKIRVIPRSKGEGVFEGVIYIVEDQWSIHSLFLETFKLGFTFNIDQVYAPIEDKVWLPVNQKFIIDGKIFGFVFEYQYLAAMSKYDITLNPDLGTEFEVIDETIEAVPPTYKNKEKDDLETKLSTGEELTRKDLRQLMKAYEKAERQQQEEPEVIETTSYIVDSMATKRDSTYWQRIRPVPLTEMEVKGYQRADSLARVSAEEKDSLENIGVNKEGRFNWLSIIGGGSYEIADKQYLAHSAIWDRFNFNPVEGFNLNVDLSYAISKKNRFAFTLTPRYAFSRKELTGKANMSYTFGNGLKRHNFNIEGGRYISQYNARNPISYFFNTFVNLVEERNFIRLFEKDYLRLSHNHKIKENWILNVSVEWAERFHLQNTTDWSFSSRGDREYAPNDFVNGEYSYPIPDSETAFVLNLGIETRPWQKYRIRNGEKEPIANASPTISLNYRQGLPGVMESQTDYSMAQFGLEHQFRLGVRGEVHFKGSIGHFFQNDYVGFADFQHFRGNQLLLIPSDPVGSYRLLPYYEYSTFDQFASVHLHYQFRKLLFSRIPEVWLLGIKENLFINYLATPLSDNYTEVGYSIDNIFRFFRVETAVSFDESGYLDWGIFIGVSSSIGGNVFNIQ
jgi:hypothetical protein